MFVVVALTACGGGGGNKPTGGPRPAEGRTISDFDLPVPPGATRTPGHDETLVGFTVDDFGSLVAFYDRWMPAGERWGDFAFCPESSGPGDTGSEWRIWHANGSKYNIAVILGDPPGDEPPYVQLGFEADDPEDC